VLFRSEELIARSEVRRMLRLHLWQLESEQR